MRTTILSNAHICQIKAAIDYIACSISKPREANPSCFNFRIHLRDRNVCLISELHLSDVFGLLFATSCILQINMEQSDLAFFKLYGIERPCIFQLIWNRATMYVPNYMEEIDPRCFQSDQSRSIALPPESRGIHVLNPIQ